MSSELLNFVLCPGCGRTGSKADFVAGEGERTWAACVCGYEWPDEERAPTLAEVLADADAHSDYNGVALGAVVRVLVQRLATPQGPGDAAGEVEALRREVCPEAGKCHGSLCWCDICGDVRMLCTDAACDVHRERWTEPLTVRQADLETIVRTLQSDLRLAHGRADRNEADLAEARRLLAEARAERDAAQEELTLVRMKLRQAEQQRAEAIEGWQEKMAQLDEARAEVARLKGTDAVRHEREECLGWVAGLLGLPDAGDPDRMEDEIEAAISKQSAEVARLRAALHRGAAATERLAYEVEAQTAARASQGQGQAPAQGWRVVTEAEPAAEPYLWTWGYWRADGQIGQVWRGPHGWQMQGPDGWVRVSAPDLYHPMTGPVVPAMPLPATPAAPPPVAPTDLRTAARRYVDAIDARLTASRERARVEAQTFKGRSLPKRIPRNAVNLADLSAEERAALEQRLAWEMAPYNAASKADADARTEEAAALDALRSALAAPLPAADPLRERLEGLAILREIVAAPPGYSDGDALLCFFCEAEADPGKLPAEWGHTPHCLWMRARSLLSSTGKEESDGRP